MQVVDVHRVLDGLESKIIGRAHNGTALDAAAGKPHRKSIRIVVAALRGRQLGGGRAAKLTAPQDQRFIEQATLLQVLEQRRDRLVALRR